MKDGFIIIIDDEFKIIIVIYDLELSFSVMKPEVWRTDVTSDFRRRLKKKKHFKIGVWHFNF